MLLTHYWNYTKTNRSVKHLCMYFSVALLTKSIKLRCCYQLSACPGVDAVADKNTVVQLLQSGYNNNSTRMYTVHEKRSVLYDLFLHYYFMKPHRSAMFLKHTEGNTISTQTSFINETALQYCVVFFNVIEKTKHHSCKVNPMQTC